MTPEVDVLPHGTRLEHHRGRIYRGVDREGHEAFRLHWDDDVLVQASLFRPDRSEVIVRRSDERHPLFGRVDLICDPLSEQVLGRAAAVEWSHPGAIPPLDNPGALRAGTGTTILNLLAFLAQRGGARSLHYLGPYPTAALFGTLLQSFRVQGDPGLAEQRFTEDVERIALSGRMVENPVDFLPAPHELTWTGPGVFAPSRDGVERIHLDGWTFDAVTAGPRRIRTRDETLVLLMEIAGEPWAEVAVLDTTGRLLRRAKALPDLAPGLVGTELPPEIASVLAHVLQERSPRLLQPAIARVLGEHPLRWGATGLALARFDQGAFEVHAALAERLPDRTPGEILGLLVDALESVVRRVAQESLIETDPGC